MTRSKDSKETAGLRIFGRRIGRVQSFVVLAGAFCISAAASIVEGASLPFWANMAALCLALLLVRGVFLRLSKPNTKRQEERRRAPDRYPRASTPAGVSDGLARAPLARPLHNPDASKRRVP